MTSKPNVANLLRERETGSRQNVCAQSTGVAGVDKEIRSWREDDFINHCKARYASFTPSPRSTIALCYNCDGSLLASTHGDHTVKISHCGTRTIMKVLAGHRRTPWVVRFHPRKKYILASGSLDHEVRLWDAETGECIRKHTFGKPIASLSFHVDTDVLAIACGHKLYMWSYAQTGNKPEIVLKTRRSMRAVHFHPYGLPVILTAEVQDPSPTHALPHTLTENGPYTSNLAEIKLKNGDEFSIDDALQQHESEQTRPAKKVEVRDEPGRQASSSSYLPPSMVPLGWEVPFPDAVSSPYLSRRQTEEEISEEALAAARTSYASVWNILGEDQPPRVRLRVWSFNTNKVESNLENGDRLLLEVSDAVLCSEMGVHFSQCGYYLAATISCRQRVSSQIPEIRREVSNQGTMDWSPERQEVLGTSANQALPVGRGLPGSLPIPDRVVFEVRIISMDGPDFGSTLCAKRIRAAHCLTSVQFSPTSNHLLLAYGKKHSSLLRSLVAQQNALIPLHTILEIVNVSEMKVIRALPSAEDEINAACFHPHVGGGLAYGTKEGKLRYILSDRDRFGPSQKCTLKATEEPSEARLQELQDIRVYMHQQWLNSAREFDY